MRPQPSISSSFQSTFPRRERRPLAARYVRRIHISIHAPAKGATPFLAGFCSAALISIHAPVKGATIRPSRVMISTVDFNPRSREESDRLHLMMSLCRQKHFNPRSREGSDYSHVTEEDVRELFQSTLPRRKRHKSLTALGDFAKFQSTLPRRERQGLLIWRFGMYNISIHAPAKGATHGRYACHLRQIISIHAPAKGATRIYWILCNGSTFQSTLPRRERHRGLRRCPERLYISIHAPVKGATRRSAADTVQTGLFQSTLP